MKILMATSEAVPFAKTGGLADVCGSLPAALARLGHQAAVILPAYRQTRSCGVPIEPLGIEFSVPIASKTVTGQLLAGKLPDTEVPVYLVRQDHYFDRDELYTVDGEDFVDNCERFVFFSRAVLEAVRLLELNVDVIHANDWQTGLVPAYLKIEYDRLPRYQQIASLMTIHNMGYQGQFWHWDMLLTGLDWKHFNWREMECHGNLNLLKTGLAFADGITTVSPRYAEEIQSPQFGYGLEGILRHRHEVISGILNGIDQDIWDPATDPMLSPPYTHYTLDTLSQGKPACKAALQAEMGLPQRPEVPLIAMIGRLADQKGLDMVADVLPRWLDEVDAQWVVLGTGEPEYHKLLEGFATDHPAKMGVRLAFSNELAHRIEAGADLFLMPSRYEPCGLNQMYSLRYGTVPVVRRTGGLADTIVDASDRTLADQTANGFSFQDDRAQALDDTLHRAHDAYNRPEIWNRLIATGMSQDWSWDQSARRYVETYQRAIDQIKSPVLDATPLG